ncbi:MAG: 16S rRNA (uracil(1498)-N(3))-methyltransferase [Thermodesulfobacteriota bacterium]|nr:MAG: 16S rRNA (uracil(1498)-N(3))-methyltransferase [Thermodesulfobacteriota bacterium]
MLLTGEEMGAYGRIRLNLCGELEKRTVLEADAFKNLKLWAPRVAEALTVVDGEGKLFRARVLGIKEDTAEVLLFEKMASQKGILPEVTLLQALPDRERMELIIEKAVELGVTRIIPFKSNRSISLEERELRQKKAHKWGDIARRASKQSRRDFMARVLSYTTFEGALKEAGNGAVEAVLWEKEGSRYIKEILTAADIPGAQSGGAKKITLLSGPEGGFDDDEIAKARSSGFIPVTLGPWILRAETAAITAVALVMYEVSC